ncbi:unnamed protein product [Closterium sp. NIES-64]|nr:unnamed protein product [Closterium sp. NIES-64]
MTIFDPSCPAAVIPAPGSPPSSCSRWKYLVFGDCVCSARDAASLYLGLFSIACWAVAEVPQVIANCQASRSGVELEEVPLALVLTWIVGVPAPRFLRKLPVRPIPIQLLCRFSRYFSSSSRLLPSPLSSFPMSLPLSFPCAPSFLPLTYHSISLCFPSPTSPHSLLPFPLLLCLPAPNACISSLQLPTQLFTAIRAAERENPSFLLSCRVLSRLKTRALCSVQQKGKTRVSSSPVFVQQKGKTVFPPLLSCFESTQNTCSLQRAAERENRLSSSPAPHPAAPRPSHFSQSPPYCHITALHKHHVRASTAARALSVQQEEAAAAGGEERQETCDPQQKRSLARSDDGDYIEDDYGAPNGLYHAMIDEVFDCSGAGVDGAGAGVDGAVDADDGSDGFGFTPPHTAPPP